MARVKLQLPDNFIYSTEIPIRISDINYGGHLSNDAVLTIMHEARLAFLKHFGYSELDIGGVSLIMGDTAVVYKSEGFHGDALRVDMAVGEFSNSSFDIYYRITSVKTNDDVAHAKTGMVCYDYDKAKVMRVPKEFRQKLDTAAT